MKIFSSHIVSPLFFSLGWSPGLKEVEFLTLWGCGVRSLASCCPWACAGWHLLASEVSSFLPFMELPYSSPGLKSTSGDLKVHPFGLATSVSESLTTSSVYLAGPEIQSYPLLWDFLSHTAGPELRIQATGKLSSSGKLTSGAPSVYHSALCLWLRLTLDQDSFLPKFTMQDHLPCTPISYCLMNLTCFVLPEI